MTNASGADAPPKIVPPEEDFGLYLHWPYCASKCPYCDFNSHVVEGPPEVLWRRALTAEITALAAALPGQKISSVFFGGGTPSLMAADTVGEVLAAVARHFSLTADCEITLEANPSSAEAAKLRDFRAAGVNRLSLGVQSLDADALTFLGRRHDVATARAAVASARGIFDNLSFDLIYARRGQSWAAWRAELDQALALAPDHIALYQLTIEPGTPFALRAGQGETLTLDERAAAAMFAATRDHLAAAGLPAYEVSNHARAGYGARHNLTYWRYQPYAGLGPGAHGRLPCADPVGGRGRLATQRKRRPETWMAAVNAAPQAAVDGHFLDRRTRLEEALMMGLRLVEGVDLAALEQLTGAPLDAWVAPARRADLIAEGLLSETAERLRAVGHGALMLDGLLAYLLADRTAP